MDNLFRSLNNAINQRIDYQECMIVSEWRQQIVDQAAEAAAQAAGLEGDAAEQFCNGFQGVNIKACNPRKHGLLAEFKAGVAARKSQDAQINAATRRAYFASLSQSETRTRQVEAAGLPSNLR